MLIDGEKVGACWLPSNVQRWPVGCDLGRYLSHEGEKQAARMAAWRARQLPEGTRVWASPAVRAAYLGTEH